MRITILNLADKFVLKFKRLFYAQVSEVRLRFALYKQTFFSKILRHHCLF